MQLRDIVLILAGAEAFHTLSHMWLGTSGVLPLQVKMPHMTVTARLNIAAVIVNALVTVGLFWWALRL